MAEQIPAAERATLRSVLNYDPEQYLTDAEVSLIKSTFHNNPRLIAILRKLMLPTLADPSLPIEQMGKDIFMEGRQWAQIPADEAKILYVAREDAAKFIIGGLVQLKNIAAIKDETPMEQALRRSKDSTK